MIVRFDADNTDDDADDDDEDEDDLDYNGSSSSGSSSDSIVLKLGSKNVNSTKWSKSSGERATVVDAATGASESNAGISNASTSTATSNYNYNNENYYSKDDMSVYDDVNNNRLNLRSNNNGRSNAYEERNLYVVNNVLSDSAVNDSVKSYIHIEVYKGNLDGAMTAKPKNAKSMNAFDVKATAKSQQQLHLNGTDSSTTEISTTKP